MTAPEGAQVSPDGSYWWDEVSTGWKLIVKEAEDIAAAAAGGVPPITPDTPYHPQTHGEFDPSLHGEFDPQIHGPFHPEIHGQFDPQKHGDFHPQTHGDFDKQKHGDYNPQVHGPFHPEIHGQFDQQQHGDFHPQSHGQFHPQTHGDFDPSQHGAFHPQQHGDFHPQTHGDFDAQRHGQFDPATHGAYDPAMHGDAGGAAADHQPADFANFPVFQALLHNHGNLEATLAHMGVASNLYGDEQSEHRTWLEEGLPIICAVVHEPVTARGIAEVGTRVEASGSLSWFEGWAADLEHSGQHAEGAQKIREIGQTLGNEAAAAQMVGG